MGRAQEVGVEKTLERKIERRESVRGKENRKEESGSASVLYRLKLGRV